jgi:hypothetical protein
LTRSAEETDMSIEIRETDPDGSRTGRQRGAVVCYRREKKQRDRVIRIVAEPKVSIEKVADR